VEASGFKGYVAHIAGVPPNGVKESSGAQVAPEKLGETACEAATHRETKL